MKEEQLGVQREWLPFTMIENAVIMDLSLSKEAIMVYLALCLHADKSGKCFPSLTTIARESRSSRLTVTRCLKKLCGLGYLVCASRDDGKGGRASNLYTIKGKRNHGGVVHVSTGGSTEITHPLVYVDNSNYTHSSNQTSSADAQAKKSSPQSLLTALFFEQYKKRLGQAPKWTGKDAKLLKGDLARLGGDKLSAAVRLFFDGLVPSAADFADRAGWTYNIFHSQLGKIEEALARQARRLSLLKVCKACGKASETSGLDCPKCGEPDAYRIVEEKRAAN